MKEHLNNTWTNLRRSPYQSLAAVSVMVLTFFVASVVALLAAGSQTVLRYFETRPQVTAFFKDETTVEQVDQLQQALVATGKVDQVHYVSKEEALEIYRKQNKDAPLLLEMVTASILPASLEVAATDLSYLEEIAAVLQQHEGVEEVIFQQDIVTALQSLTSTVRQVGLGVVAFLGLVSMLIVMVIISMKVAAKRAEIKVLHLIGAARGYILTPFVLEGTCYGLAGAFLGWGLVYLLLLYSTPLLVNFFSGISFLPIPVVLMLALLGGELLVGAFIGSFSGLLAVKRYLK
ncbi:hypothetical protein COT66_00490 [Candidatus Shapirobacteria bacterium CG09_land_8_20_14_0_10_49_15]|uniref:Cell division protein FtsX n=2 Tax=Candidatus Shapironibacteriota TaxID=1752721 RepID=A0A2M8L719_9BACT|nr:MAG: hypothetical protein COT66_00490 [Candidatus Shapirobacteria bacterium CG09_land_8_20_14_0_10_49_15]PJE70039.1 MAG: hypothetical protein COU97_01870 [Candidatus Shapirobacteria bacterium CG10_big_fil_rev_8_21_14_0_10_48_15]